MTYDILNKMKNDGWQLRFSASGERLDEAVNNYKSLGFDVKTVQVKELNNDACSICFDDESDNSAMIFTRKDGDAESNGLFDD